jgi:hypothetical protein
VKARLSRLFLVTDNGPSFIARRFADFVREPYSHVRIRYRTPHWALVPEEGGNPLVPAEVYTGTRSIQIPRWQDWARAASARLEVVVGGRRMSGHPGGAFVGIVPPTRGAHRRRLHPRLASLCSLKNLFSDNRETFSHNRAQEFHLNPVPRQMRRMLVARIACAGNERNCWYKMTVAISQQWQIG